MESGYTSTLATLIKQLRELQRELHAEEQAERAAREQAQGSDEILRDMIGLLQQLSPQHIAALREALERL